MKKHKSVLALPILLLLTLVTSCDLFKTSNSTNVPSASDLNSTEVPNSTNEPSIKDSTSIPGSTMDSISSNSSNVPSVIQPSASEEKPSTPTSTSVSVVEQARPFKNVTRFESPVDVHTADQKSFVEYKGGYENLTADYIRTTWHVDGNSSKSDPNAIHISWEQNALSTLSKYVVEFSTSNTFENSITFEGTKSKSIDIYNLFIGQKYYYRIKAMYPSGAPDVSETFELTTADAAPRNLKINGMTNCRDLGGRTTVNGARLKQGLIYRTAALDDNQSGSVITSDGKKIMTDFLKVKTEIELRGGANGSGGETSNTTSSKLGSSVNFEYIPFAYSYGKNLLFRNIEPVRKVFDVLGDESNYPVFYHCRIGTDRTGVVSFLINALLGVELQEIYQDYLFSDFGSIGKTSTVGQNNEDSIAGYVAQLQTFPGETLQNKVYNFLVTAGVPAEKLDTMINLMTEGTTPANEANKINVTSVNAMEVSGSTVQSANAVRSPANSVKLNGAGQKVSYLFSNDKAFTATLYANLMSHNTSETLKSALKVTLDGNEVNVNNTSFATNVLGFGNQADYWIPAELANINVSKLASGEHHTLTIESKGKAEISISHIAMQMNTNAVLVNENNSVTPVNCDHKSVNSSERAGGELETATSYLECLDCGERTISWNAKKYIVSESNDVENNTNYIRFSKVENQDKNGARGTHIVYEVYSPVAVENAKLSIKAEFNTGASTWAAESNDNTKGYITDANGNQIVSPYRYGLLINDVKVDLNEETHNKPAGGNVWEEMPATFTLKPGLNKIELVSFGGYRAKMYEMKIVGKSN